MSELDATHSKHILAVNLTTSYLLLMISRHREAIDFVKHASKIAIDAPQSEISDNQTLVASIMFVLASKFSHKDFDQNFK